LLTRRRIFEHFPDAVISAAHEWKFEAPDGLPRSLEISFKFRHGEVTTTYEPIGRARYGFELK